MASSGTILEILEKSLVKNGDKPITVGHLINIIKLADKVEESDDNIICPYEDKCY